MASRNLCRNIFLLCHGKALPLDFGALDKRKTTDLVGYFAVFFKGDATANQRVWVYMSNGNDPCSFCPLNGDQRVLIPKGGTGATRDMSIVVGRGNKWYIVGTDLDLAKARLPEHVHMGKLRLDHLGLVRVF